jgi:hypothetical protein
MLNIRTEGSARLEGAEFSLEDEPAVTEQRFSAHRDRLCRRAQAESIEVLLEGRVERSAGWEGDPGIAVILNALKKNLDQVAKVMRSGGGDGKGMMELSEGETDPMREWGILRPVVPSLPRRRPSGVGPVPSEDKVGDVAKVIRQAILA